MLDQQQIFVHYAFVDDFFGPIVVLHLDEHVEHQPLLINLSNFLANLLELGFGVNHQLLS